MTLLRQHLQVGNCRGVHGRVATRLAEIASQYDVCLRVYYNDEVADCSSILDVLAMALVQGTDIELEVEGGDRETAGALAAAKEVIISQDAS